MNGPSLRRTHAKLPHDVRRLSFMLRHPRLHRSRQALRQGPDSFGYTLEPFDQHQCIFVHVPKCAGVSVSRALFGNLAGGHRSIDSYRLLLRRRDFHRYFKFAFVRNPWDRLVSAFHFLKKGGFNAIDKQWADEHLGDYSDFHAFVTRWLTPENAGRWVHFMPQTHFTCVNGKLLLDFVGRFENLAHDYDRLRRRLQIGGPLPCRESNAARRGDYKAYYTPETRHIVGDVYHEDIAILGYDFENDCLPTRNEHRRTAA